MNAPVVCPECKRKLKVPEIAAGKALRCPACKAVIPAAKVTATNELDISPSESPEREGVTTAPAEPPRIAPLRDPRLEDKVWTDEEAQPKKKPVRKGTSTGLIVGLIVGGVLLVLGIAGAGVGLIVYLVLNRTIPEAEWQPFSPPDSGCTVLMPGTPLPRSQTIKGLLLNKYHLERKKEKVEFGVAFIDLGATPIPRDTLEVLTKGERDHMEGQTNGKITSESAISLGNIPGREFQLVPKDGGMLIERFYLAKIGSKHRVYLLVAAGNYLKPNQGDAARFFDSFQLTVPATPPEYGIGPVVQQPPVVNRPAVNPPRPNPALPMQRQPRPRPNRRPNPSGQAGQRRVWQETSGTQTLCLAFSPDSATLAVGHWDKKMRLWDVAGGKDRQVIPVTGSVMAVAFSSDGKRLACGTDNGDLSEVIVFLWDISDANAPKQLQRISLRHTRDKARARALCFTPDGKSLAIALVPDSHSGSQIVLWDLENNKERAAHRDCKEDVKKLAFTSDGAVVILMPSSVRVWDTSSNQIRREVKGQNPAEQFITTALASDGQTLATMCQDKKLRMWRLSDGVCFQTWPVTVDLIRQNGCPFEFSPDGKYLAMRGQGAKFHVWDAKTGKELKVANKGVSFANIDVMAFSPDCQLLAWHGNQGPQIVEVATLITGN